MLPWSKPKTESVELLATTREFLEFVCRGIVDTPEALTIEGATTGSSMLFVISSTAREDLSKIIGRQGRTIDAIRTLVINAAGKYKLKAWVQVSDYKEPDA